jgi:hypothetical protein
MPLKPPAISTSNLNDYDTDKKVEADGDNDVKMEDGKDELGTPKLDGLAQNTVVFWDYDDTLLASSFLSGKGYRLDSDLEKTSEIEAGLKELEASVKSVLSMALKFGHVHIVTNAETGWVQLSAQKFMPGIVPLLSKVKVISARSTYESQHPDAPLRWKFCAFQEALSQVYGGTSGLESSKVQKNVISFGDSHVEREAVRAVTRGLPNLTCKSVKFAERPSLEQLRRQVDLVGSCFAYIVQHDSELDLQLTVSCVAKPGTPPSPITPTGCRNDDMPMGDAAVAVA